MDKEPVDVCQLDSLIKKITLSVRKQNWINDIYSNIISQFPNQQLPKNVLQALLYIAINDYKKCIFTNKDLISYGRKIPDFKFEDSTRLREVIIFGENIDNSFLLNKIYCSEKEYRNVKEQILNKKIILPDSEINIDSVYAIEKKFIKDFLIQDYRIQNNRLPTEEMSNAFGTAIAESYNTIKDRKYRDILKYHKIITEKQISYIFKSVKNIDNSLFFSEYEHSFFQVPRFDVKFNKTVYLSNSLKNIISIPDNIQNEIIKEKIKGKPKTPSKNKKLTINRLELEEYMKHPVKTKNDVILLMENIEKIHSLPDNIREKNKYRAIISGIIKGSIDCYVTGESIEKVVFSGNQQEHEFSNGDTLSFDHLFPQCFNGINSLINGMPMCAKANSKKSDLVIFESNFGLVTIKPISAYNITMVQDYIYGILHKNGYSKNKSRELLRTAASTEIVFDKTFGNIRKKALLHYSNYYREQELCTIEKILGKDIFDKDKALAFFDATSQYKFGEYRLRPLN